MIINPSPPAYILYAFGNIENYRCLFREVTDNTIHNSALQCNEQTVNTQTIKVLPKPKIIYVNNLSSLSVLLHFLSSQSVVLKLY